MEKDNRSPEQAGGATSAEKPLVAVVELGTTSIRMAIAEVEKDGGFNPLESLQQAVMLGKDTFTQGYIKQETIEECVKGLKSFRQILSEYRIVEPGRIKAVATSAIREASNRDAVLDRILIATGLNVEAIEDAEVSRFTYLAVHPMLASIEAVKDSDSLVIEVGGGSTDVLMLRKGHVGNSQVFRLGSFRLRKMLDDYRAPDVRLRQIMKSHVDRAVSMIKGGLGSVESPVLVALGGDARFAASQIVPDWDKKGAVRIQVSALSKLTDDILRMQADEIVKAYHVSYPDAETLGPALLVYVRLAELLKIKQMIIGNVTLRDGVLCEMATHGSWTDDFKEQIISSAVAIGKKYGFDQRHGEHVAGLSRRIFAALQDEHQLEPRYDLILLLAALLHETGHFISNRSHHKHSMYLILNSDVFGLGSRDLKLAALIARYHRKAEPKSSHELYASLDRHDRVIVAKLAAILRVADALDSGLSQQLTDLDITVEAGKMTIEVANVGDLAIERHSLQDKGRMFEQVYGMKVVLKEATGKAS